MENIKVQIENQHIEGWRKEKGTHVLETFPGVLLSRLIYS